MTIVAQLAFFVSAYSPLFAVFALLDTLGTGWPTTTCTVLAALGAFLPTVVFMGAQRMEPQPLQPVMTETRTGDAVAYIVTYLVPFAAISATSARQKVAVMFMLALIAVTYVRAELFFVNPYLTVIGYRLFQVATPSGTTILLLTRRRFVQPGVALAARRLSDYVYWEKQ